LKRLKNPCSTDFSEPGGATGFLPNHSTAGFLAALVAASTCSAALSRILDIRWNCG
jgi:hypothetical protein